MKCSNTRKLLLCSRCNLMYARKKQSSMPSGLHHLPDPTYLTTTIKRSDSLHRPTFTVCRANFGLLSESQFNAPGLFKLYNTWKISVRVFDKIFTFPKCQGSCSSMQPSNKLTQEKPVEVGSVYLKWAQKGRSPYSWIQQLVWLTIYSVVSMFEEAGSSYLSLWKSIFTWAQQGCNLPLMQACYEVTILLMLRINK